MTILVTGGLGFIGSHVIKAFIDQDESMVATSFGDEAVASFLVPHLGKQLSIESADITDTQRLIDLCRKHKVRSIVHLAGTPIGVMRPADEYRINMMGLLNIVEAAKAVGASRVSMASSIAVYMGLTGPFTEDMTVRLRPGHVIEAFKKAEELLGLYLAGSDGLDFVALRLANIYGPLYRSRRHWPSQLVHAAVGGTAAPLPASGMPAFRRNDHATDFCYVTDAAQGIYLVHSSERLKHSAYNIGGGQHLTYGDIADKAAALFPGLDIALEDGTSSHDWPGSTLDISRAHADAGYRPAFSIEQAMEGYASWLREGHAF